MRRLKYLWLSAKPDIEELFYKAMRKIREFSEFLAFVTVLSGVLAFLGVINIFTFAAITGYTFDSTLVTWLIIPSMFVVGYQIYLFAGIFDQIVIWWEKAKALEELDEENSKVDTCKP